MIERECAAFAALLQPGSLGLDVATCPGWTLGDLAQHVGGVQRWARDAVLLDPGADPPAEDAMAPSAPAAVAPWFAAGTALLIDALSTADPDQPSWTFADPRTVRFWLRRQAHEAAMHRWDAATALGQQRTFEHELAHDGIAEVLEMFLPRQLRLGRLPALPGSLALQCDCGRVDVVGDAGAPDATVHGSVSTLLLLLWRRVQLPASDVVTSGDTAAATRLLALPLTP